MAEYLTNDVDLTAIADAIRTKGGTSEQLEYPDGFVTAIENLSTGSGAVTIDEYADTNGGTVKDIIAVDISNDTVTAAALKKGYTAHGADGTAITGTLDVGEASDVVFIDYDGTVIDSKTKAEINAMTSDFDLPANPTHTGLTAQGWNWTVAQLKAQLTAIPNQKVYVGQMYISASGATEIDIELVDNLALSPYLCIGIDGSVTIDWGDNSATDTVTGTDTTSRKYTQHVYQTTGNYTISITVNSGTFRFYVTNQCPILTDKNTSSQYASKKYSSSIKRIRLGENVDNDSIFRDHYSLESITIPSSITKIASSAFNGCYSLTSVTIPAGVTSIWNSVFYYCYSITSITIPSSVTSIKNNAFGYCSSLVNISIPSSVTSIEYSAFYQCLSLTNVIIPSGVTNIGNNTFQNCFPLASIVIPSGITSIGNYAFASCYSITDIIIPSEVTSIGDYAFSNCYSLTSITTQSKITSIGEYTFTSCFSLTSITIPSSVTNIGNSAFYKCYSMLEYHFEPTTPPTLGTSAFTNIQSDCIIYVPYSEDHSILEAYQTATNWSAYASYMQEEPQ